MATKNHAAELAALQETIGVALAGALIPLVTEIECLKARLDNASKAMAVVMAEVKLLRAARGTMALVAKTEPARIPPAEFARALDDMRAEANEAGSDRRFWPVPDIRARAMTLRTMETNTRAAGDDAETASA